MSDIIVEASKGFGFQLTRFAGGEKRGRCYQIDVGTRNIDLTDWEMLQLVTAFIKDHNEQAIKANQR